MSTDLLREAQNVLMETSVLGRTLARCDHYVGKQAFFDKALLLRAVLGPVFDITLDLEDGAAAGEHGPAAHWARRCLESIAHEAIFDEKALGQWGVRIHDVQHPAFIDELNILLHTPLPALRYIMLPKARCSSDVQQARHMIQKICAAQAWPRVPELHVLIETHGAVAEVQAIAAMDGVESLSFGLMDFVSAHRGALPDTAMQSPLQFEHALVRQAKIDLSAACHRFGKVPSHNVCTDVRKPEQAFLDAQRAHAEMGYMRMWSIHPTQVEPILRAFEPSSSLVKTSWAILEKASKAQWEPIEHAGRLHDKASFRYYLDVLINRRFNG